jgi:hypothetical protein
VSAAEVSGTIGLHTMTAAVSGHLDNDSIGMLAVTDGDGKLGDIGVMWGMTDAGSCKAPVVLES